MQKEPLESVWFTGNGCKQMSLERIWCTLSTWGTSSAPSVDMESAVQAPQTINGISLLSTHYHTSIHGHYWLSWLHSKELGTHIWFVFKYHSYWGWGWVIYRTVFKSPYTIRREDAIFHPVFLLLLLNVLFIKRQESQGLNIQIISGSTHTQWNHLACLEVLLSSIGKHAKQSKKLVVKRTLTAIANICKDESISGARSLYSTSFPYCGCTA